MVFTHPHTYFISASFSFRTQTLQTDPFRHLSLILSGSIRAENFSTVCRHVRQTVRLQTDHNSEAHCPRLRILLAQLIPDLVSHQECPFSELKQSFFAFESQFTSEKPCLGQLYKWPHPDLLRRHIIDIGDGANPVNREGALQEASDSAGFTPEGQFIKEVC